jgi:ribulose bisphosphate carboxylase small subunit
MKVERNVMINKAGGNAGKESVNYRISLPAEFVKLIGVTPDDKSVIVEFIDEKITITKKIKTTS